MILENLLNNYTEKIDLYDNNVNLCKIFNKIE